MSERQWTVLKKIIYIVDIWFATVWGNGRCPKRNLVAYSNHNKMLPEDWIFYAADNSEIEY